MKILFFFLSAFLVFSCKQETPTNQPILHISKVTDSMVVINQWQILGPFPSNNTEHFINEDNLKQFGLSEDSISFEKFLKISKHAAKDTSLLDTCFSNKYLFSGKIPVNFKDVFKIKSEKYRGTVYCACLIVCKRDIDTRLHFSSNASKKVWLNNKLLYSEDNTRKMDSYELFIPIKLQKGNNFFMVKLTENRDAWEMYSRLENLSENAIKRQLWLFNQAFLQDNIVNDTDTIQMLKSFPPYAGRIVISDNHNNTLISDTVAHNKGWKKNISSFKNGVYHATFNIGKVKIVHDFYKGNLHDSIQNIIAEIQTAKIPVKIKDNIDALIFRYKHLLTQTYLTDKKFVALFIQLNNANSSIKKGDDPYSNTVGWFIRTYISDIDSSKQYYLLHVPSSYHKNKPVAIAVIVPAIVEKLPYLESFRVGNIKLINFFQSLAEKHNMILVQPGSRRMRGVNKNSIEEKELFAILDNIRSNYTIDNKRIYLSGTCSGGDEALKLATVYPDLFAAVGLVSPEVIYPNENSRLSPVPSLKNITNTPVYNIHSKIDRHVAFERSELLSRIFEEIGMKNFEYVRLPNEYPQFYSDDFFDEALEFCSKHTLNPSPKEIDFTTWRMLYNKSYWITLDGITGNDTAYFNAKINRWNTLTIEKKNVESYTIDLRTLPYRPNSTLKVVDNGKVVFKGITKDSVLQIGSRLRSGLLYKTNSVSGPFSEVYTQKFIVVTGTCGSPKETKGLDSLAQKLNLIWTDKYLFPCKIKKDSEITDKDIAEASLLLLGNFNSNLILKRIQNKLPLSITTEGVKICNKEAKGEKIAFYMIYPNPLNNKKYVAVAGYNNDQYISFDACFYYDISNHGWYDYKVWDAETREEGIILGNFNQYWSLTNN